MYSFLWKKGFYFNKFFFSYALFNFKYFKNIFCTLYGISSLFYSIFINRLELNFKFKNKILLNLFNNNNFFLFIWNLLLLKIYPLSLSLKFQKKLNIYKYYLIKSYKGISLFLSKPLKNKKTRSRSYFFKKKIWF